MPDPDDPTERVRDREMLFGKRPRQNMKHPAIARLRDVEPQKIARTQ